MISQFASREAWRQAGKFSLDYARDLEEMYLNEFKNRFSFQKMHD